jgi:TctA family transporter
MNQDDIRIFDWSALGITAASFMEWLPALSAALSAIWFGLRIIQTLREMKHGRRD